jgi:hypothetical protein
MISRMINEAFKLFKMGAYFESEYILYDLRKNDSIYMLPLTEIHNSKNSSFIECGIFNRRKNCHVKKFI